MREIIKDIAHEIREIESGKKSVRKFGIILSVILFIVAGLLWRKDNPLWMEFAAGGAAAGIAAYIVIPVIKPLYYGMTVISIVIGYFVSRLILAMIFFLLFAPIGVAARIFGRDLLNKKIDRTATTYWLKKEKQTFDKKQYERLF